MKKVSWLNYLITISIIIIGCAFCNNKNVNAMSSLNGYYEYDFIKKEETFGEISNTKIDLANNVSDGSLGSLPYTSEIEPHTVIGSDGRSEVKNTTSIPVRWVGYLLSYWPDGKVTRGTAWLYGDSVAMTAGHCIYDYDKQTYPSKITFSPGYNNGEAPYGTFSVSRGRVTQQYRNNRDSRYDAGIIKLSSPIGKKVGYFSFAYNDNVDAYLNKSVWIDGYPGDKDRKMYRMQDTIQKATENNLYYQIDTYAGQSGSPIFYKDPNDANKRICIGIHTNGVPKGFIDVPRNSGVRICKMMYNWMKTTQEKWMTDVEPPIFTDGSEFWP